MLNKPSQRVISALSSLEGNADFDVVHAWLRESLEHLKTEGSTAREEYLVRWNQGAVQALSELEKYMSDAREILRKFR